MYEFSSTEFKFPSSEFAKNPQIKKIPIDISNISAQNVDVDSYCDSFTFPNMGSVLDNRFIVWKSEGSNLYLQEYSTERDLKSSSLCINVAPSVIVPGTQISFSQNCLTLTIVTQFVICSLDLPLSEDMVDELKCTSALHYFYISSENVLKRVYNFKNQAAFAVKACVASPNGFSPHVVVCLNVKNEVIVIKVPKAGVPNGKVEETNLNSTGFLEYFTRPTENKKVIDLHAISTSEDTYVLTLHNEAVVKLWSTNSCTVVDRINVCEYFRTSLSSINNIYIKTATLNKEKFAVIFARSICEKSFIGLFSICSDRFDFCCQSFITSQSFDHQDFIVVPAGKTFDLGVDLYILSRKPNNYTVDDDIPVRQPYIIEKCWINTKIPHETAETVSVIPVVNAYDVPFLNDFTMEDDSSEQTSFYKRVVFDKEVFSSEVVQKAVAINCKMNKKDVPLEDYLALRSLIKSYIKSPKFKQDAMGTPGQKRVTDNLVSHNMEIALLNFWKKLLQTCYELQYVANEAIGLWKAENIGLVGSILNNQLTVISSGDYVLSQIVTNVLKKSGLKSIPFSQLAKNIEKQKKGVVAVNVIEKSKNVKFLETLHDELSQSLYLLTVEPSELTTVISTSEYIGSSFTVELLSSTLRNLIGGRTYFASRLLDIYKFIPKCQGNKLVKENETIKKQLDQIRNLYGVLFQTLTLPLRIGRESHSPNITLSTSFFKYMQKHKPTLMMKPMVFPESTPFSLYLSNVLYATVYSMYPASLSSAFLKYFIATDKFEYLVDFIGKCNNQAPELKYSNLLCNGLACVASGKVSKAFNNIILALKGINTKDLALNNLLKQLMPSVEYGESLVYIEAIELLIRYFMFKNYHEISIQLGKYATESIDLPENRLSSVYNLLFSVYLRKGDFLSSLECLKNISNADDRSKSLRLIVGILMEPKNRPSFISLTTGQLSLSIMEYLEERANDCDDLITAGDDYLFNVAFMARRTKYLRSAYNMYHYSCKLGQSIDSWQQLQKRCKALSETKHLLSLSSEEKYLNVKEDLSVIYSRHCLNTYKVTEEDIMKQLMLSEARLALMDIYQTNSIPPEDKDILERELVNHNLFDMAWTIIMYFGTSPKRFFKTVTEQCIIVEASGSDTPPEWVLHNIKNLKDCIEMEGRHYMILKCYLEQHLSANPCDSEVLRVIFYEFLRYNFPAPEWFVEIFTTKNLPEYLRCLLEYNEIEKVHSTLLTAIDKAIHDVGVHKKHNPILPVTVIEQFLYLAIKGGFNKNASDVEAKVLEYFKKVRTIQTALKLH